ncbi:site-specific integrase [Bacillus cereus group sp. BfR-BA-01310]|uniref:tyrosine-type recombinase/integrase n=1 Tax=Bacillus cereus group sp. BfR-BA-01310 TaxID=2920287 RepID=UPI001F563F10|nr:site-specific integrase [Bacillus cereus group sp. BfR-BA-01310]
MKGTIKKEGNSWYYQFTIGYSADGKRKQKKKRGYKTKKEAQQALTEALNAVNTGTYIEPSTSLYKEYLDDWFTTKKNSIGIQTARVYQDYLRSRIVPGLGNYTLSKLSAIHIQSFTNNLNKEGLSSSTIKKVYEIVRNWLEYAADFELIPKNVAAKVKLPKANKKEMAVWNGEEVNQFLKIAKEDPVYIVFHLALTTGMRQGEILGLRWKDVDFEKGLIHIRQTLSHGGKEFIRGAKTKSSLRTINLSEATVRVLKGRKLTVSKENLSFGPIYEDLDLVACTSHKTPHNPTNVRRTFNRLIEAADVPKIRFHDLRHTHATLLFSKGINVKIISERLGHSNIKVMLDTYSHVLPTMQEEVVRKLDEIIKEV